MREKCLETGFKQRGHFIGERDHEKGKGWWGDDEPLETGAAIEGKEEIGGERRGSGRDWNRKRGRKIERKRGMGSVQDPFKKKHSECA